MSAWGDYSDTLYVSVELPQYVGNDWQDKSCSLALRVEAVQANSAAAGEETEKRIYLAENTDELSQALENFKDGETIVLYSPKQNWTNVSVEFSENKTLSLRGNAIGDLSINAPNGSVYLYNNVQTISSVIVAEESVHVFGIVGSMNVQQGRAVLEANASVNAVVVVPETNGNAKVEVVKDASVNSVEVKAAEGSVVEVVIAEEVESETSIVVENNGGEVVVDAKDEIVENIQGTALKLVKIDSDEDLVNAIKNQKDNQK